MTLLAHITRVVEVDLGSDAAILVSPSPHVALFVVSDTAHAVQWVPMTADPLVSAIPFVASPPSVAIGFPHPGVQEARAASGIAAGNASLKMDTPPRVVAAVLGLFIQPCEVTSTRSAPVEGTDRVPITTAVPASGVAVNSGPGDGKHSRSAAL